MSKINSLVVSVVALVVAIAALVMCILCCNKNKPVDVAETLNNNPEIIINAMQNYEQKMRENALAEAQKLIDDNMDALVNNPDSPVVGNKDGSVTVVEFFDFSCGYCHRLHPTMQNIIAKNPDVKVVLKELAFVAPVSNYAAKAALAANLQGKYADFWDAMMTNNGLLTEAKVDELAVKNGVDLEQMKADMNSERVNQIMKDTSDLASKIQVNGVPALVINGKMVQTLDENVIQSAIDAAKK